MITRCHVAVPCSWSGCLYMSLTVNARAHECINRWRGVSPPCCLYVTGNHSVGVRVVVLVRAHGTDARPKLCEPAARTSFAQAAQVQDVCRRRRKRGINSGQRTSRRRKLARRTKVDDGRVDGVSGHQYIARMQVTVAEPWERTLQPRKRLVHLTHDLK